MTFDNFKHSHISCFRINKTKMQCLVVMFYATILAIDYNEFSGFVKSDSYNWVHWLWPVSWLSFMPRSDQGTCLKLIFISLMINHAYCILKPHLTFPKISGGLLFFMMTATGNSFGKINHHLSGFLFVSISFIFIQFDPKDVRDESRNEFYFLISQLVFVGTYFLSGLWKLRLLIYNLVEVGFKNTQPVSSQISWSSIQEFSRLSDLGFWGHHHTIAMCTWICVIAFEMACVLAPWFPKYQRYFGLAIIFMHASTAFFLNVYYLPSALLAAILLCMNPFEPESGA